ncbi:MAG: hypothetical protein U0800_25495 [Isosphaeraceae bacterium]
MIDEIRAVRHRISEQVGHDSARLVAHYKEFQERYRDRLIRPSEAVPNRIDFDRNALQPRRGDRE